MSTRWYPRYCKGNPQLRVFLPNFIMKLVKPEVPQPPNVVNFKVSMEMSKFDVKNYLEKIYKVPVDNVKIHIRMGKFERALVGSYVVKEDDFKMAYVTLPQGEKFEFPNLFPEEKEKEVDDQLKQVDQLKEEWKRMAKKNKHRQGVPSWIGI